VRGLLGFVYAEDLNVLAEPVVALDPSVDLLAGVEVEVPLHVLRLDASAASAVCDVELDDGVHYDLLASLAAK